MVRDPAPAPWLSIVIPARNEAAGIETCLHALQPLRTQGVELILVDGHSEDDTAVKAGPWVDRVLTSPPGRALQMNAGATIAQGRLLLFLHADTRLLPQSACALRDAVEGDVRWGRFDVTIEGRSRMLPVVAGLMNLRSRLTGIATGDQAIFVTKDTFLSIGGFPIQPLMEDIELCRRLKRIAPPLCLRERVSTSGRRWDTHGAWRTILLMWRLRWRYWRGESPAQLARAYR